MCRMVTCSRCKKPTFAGCGMHVEQVLGHVPEAQRCHCRDQQSAPSSGESADAKTKSQLKKSGWL